MTQIFVALLLGSFALAVPARADDVSPDALAAIERELADIGCTVKADDVDATDDGYEADDVKCKDGEFEVSFDKDFKITFKEKDEY